MGSLVGRGSGLANAYSQGISLSLTQRLQCQLLAEPPVYRVIGPKTVAHQGKRLGALFGLTLRPASNYPKP